MTASGAARGNLLRLPPRAPGAVELIEVLAAGGTFRIERLVSTGQATPEGEWYDQGWDEWVALLQGRATLGWEDGRREELRAGDWAWIPAHARHRVEATSADPPCVWVAVHVHPGPPPP